MAPDLPALANKYETSAFIQEDPCQFLHLYDSKQHADVECASFIAAMLAFGSRKQFIPKIKEILELADRCGGSVAKWLISGAPGFSAGSKKFYRFYSYDDMRDLFGELSDILKESGSLGEHFERLWKKGGRCGGMGHPLEGVAENGEAVCSEGKAFPDLMQTESGNILPLWQIISWAFPKSKIVPKGKNSANKRVHMFLRWMVRQGSPVDLGIWDWYPQALLIMPLDVHVMQEAKNLGLLPENAAASLKTAVMLTKEMEKFFPGDPVRGDFALFGLGVDEE